MKTSMKFGLIFSLFIVFILSVSAVIQKLDGDLAYGDIDINGVSAPGYTFVVTADVNGNAVDEMAVVWGTTSGFYVKNAGETTYTAVDLSALGYAEVTLNDGLYYLLSVSDLSEVGVLVADLAGLNVSLATPAYVLLYGGQTRKNVITSKSLDLKGSALLLLNTEEILFLSQDNNLNLLSSSESFTFSRFFTIQQAEDALALAGQQAENAQNLATEQASEQASIGSQSGLDVSQACIDVDAEKLEPFAEASYAYTSGGRILVDRCQGDVLGEATCVDGTLIKEEHACAGVCKEGRCGEEALQSYCIDTDFPDPIAAISPQEMEVALKSKGATAGFYAARGGQIQGFGLWTDYCLDINTVVEYNCRNDKARFSTVQCGECSNGKCDKPFCFDSDGGDTQNVLGSVKGLLLDNSDFEVNDVCNGDTLREVVCDINTPEGYKIVQTECANGCLGGKCLPSPTVCTVDADCAAGLFCLGNLCTGTDAQAAIPCTDDNTCSFGQICGPDNFCQTGCKGDLGCRVGNLCATSVCVDEPYINGWNTLVTMLERRTARVHAYESILAQM